MSWDTERAQKFLAFYWALKPTARRLFRDNIRDELVKGGVGTRAACTAPSALIEAATAIVKRDAPRGIGCMGRRLPEKTLEVTTEEVIPCLDE